MKFIEALNINTKEVISLVGGGGKTSTMFAIAREAEQKGLKTIITTTTKIFYPDNTEFKVIVSEQPDKLYHQIDVAFKDTNTLVVGKEIAAKSGAPTKLLGLNNYLLEVLGKSIADLIIVEADGAAKKPLKAPAKHEPVIPASSTLVMPILGIDAIGSVLSVDYVHRPELVAQLSGIDIGEKITPEVVSSVFISELGYRKGVLPNARWIPFINKVESNGDLALAREIAQRIRQEVPSKVLIGAAQAEDPILEVIVI